MSSTGLHVNRERAQAISYCQFFVEEPVTLMGLSLKRDAGSFSAYIQVLTREYREFFLIVDRVYSHTCARSKSPGGRGKVTLEKARPTAGKFAILEEKGAILTEKEPFWWKIV